MFTEHGDVQFKVKEGLHAPYIVAESQAGNGKLPGRIMGMGFTLHTESLEEAEIIAQDLNEKVRQLFIVPKEAKCAKS